MSLKTRLAKLEQEHQPIGYIFVLVDDDETEEEALKRHIAENGAAPMNVIHCTPLDLLL